MRHVQVCAFVFVSLLQVAAKPPAVEPDVTVILDFKGTHSAYSIKEMQREAGQILKSSGVRLEWRNRDDVGSAGFKDLVLLTFNGACQFAPVPPRYDELGPYATTRTVSGEVLPFGEVDCDHVVSSVHSAMSGDDYSKADFLVGRALGRVVAHELVHMLTKSTEHGTSGVEKASLTARQLIAEYLPLSKFDIGRIQDRLLR